MNPINMTGYLKKFRKENIVTIFFLVIVCGLQVGANLLMMQSFQGIIDRSMRQFMFWMLLLVVLWFLIYGLSGVETFFRCRAICVMNNAIRQDITEILLKKSYRSFHERPVGEYLSQFTNDISQIENLAWNPFFDCIRSAVTVVFSIAALLTLHWSLLAASIVTTVIMLSVPKLFHKKMEYLGSVCIQEQSAAVSRLKELLTGYDVLRFFNQDKLFIRDMQKAGEQIEKPNGNLSAGLSNMTQDVLSISSAKPYFEKIAAHMEKSVETKTETKAELFAGKRMETIQKGIMINKVSYSYDKKTVLQEFSACFEKGGKYALVGPSGCGKSTLLKLMLGCLPEYTGSIRLDNQEIRNCRPEQLWHQISYIEQDVFLFNATILDNITLGGEFTREQIRKALQDSALENDLLHMPDGLDTIVGENGGNLSGGQKQRVAIARALLYNRSILLVDEGTSALDQENAYRIENNLLSKPELTLILVSHHLSAEQKKRFTRVFTLGGHLRGQ